MTPAVAFTRFIASLRFQVFRCERWIQVIVIRFQPFSFILLESVDFIDDCKKHIFDVAAAGCRSLEVPHPVPLQQLRQYLPVIRPISHRKYCCKSLLLPHTAITVRSARLSRKRSIHPCKPNNVSGPASNGEYWKRQRQRWRRPHL